MAARKGRTGGFQMSHEHRTKIGNSKILNHLIEHATGERDMTSTQVTAALGLLDRVMPKLATTKIEGGDNPVQVVTQIALVGVEANDSADG